MKYDYQYENIKRNIVSIQYGQNGCFLTIKYERSAYGAAELGARFDIPFKLNVLGGKGKFYEFDISGTWYVYDITPEPISNLSTLTLVRNSNVYKFGDGTVSNFKKIPEIYPEFDAFNESDIDYYFTWDTSVKVYKTITKIASKINVKKLPIFELDGKIKLYNIYANPMQSHSLIKADITYPPIKAVPKQAGLDYPLYSNLGDVSKISGILFPGHVYNVELKEKAVSSLETIKFIVRDLVVFRNNDDKFSGNSYVSMILDREIYQDTMLPQITPIAVSISEYDNKHFEQYNDDMTLKEENNEEQENNNS